ncbi:hypothetical protein M011DRAFT_460601 [Sporormia fimetaria CBS 119925]|uniref:F-box domain-containing protein n=1 Tax=Sporormia fimetaria CBS 119925 TaxID=1340428 RepID=A0A6A6V452_9PLEO|nr:hypothetical protein M011DRAFT_460601 [Sporormia fimetaria CBS 119925]
MQPSGKPLAVTSSRATNRRPHTTVVATMDKLPLEIFQRILQAHTDAAGLGTTWRLRLVCKSFANVIRHEILTAPKLEEFRDGAEGIFDKSPENRKYFLSHRVQGHYMGGNPHLATSINAMADFLVQESNDKTKSHACFVDMLCTFIAFERLPPVAFGSAFLALVQRCFQSDAEPTLADKLAVAAAFGYRELLLKFTHLGSVLDQEGPPQKSPFQAYSRLYGDFMAQAFRLYDAALIGQLDVLLPRDFAQARWMETFEVALEEKNHRLLSFLLSLDKFITRQIYASFLLKVIISGDDIAMGILLDVATRDLPGNNIRDFEYLRSVFITEGSERVRRTYFTFRGQGRWP